MATNTYLMNRYNEFKNKAIADGFPFEDFWNEVNNFTDPQDSSPSDWAISAELAYQTLHEKRRYDMTAESYYNYYL